MSSYIDIEAANTDQFTNPLLNVHDAISSIADLSIVRQESVAESCQRTAVPCLNHFAVESD